MIRGCQCVGHQCVNHQCVGHQSIGHQCIGRQCIIGPVRWPSASGASALVASALAASASPMENHDENSTIHNTPLSSLRWMPISQRWFDLRCTLRPRRTIPPPLSMGSLPITLRLPHGNATMLLLWYFCGYASDLGPGYIDRVLEVHNFPLNKKKESKEEATRGKVPHINT